MYKKKVTGVMSRININHHILKFGLTMCSIINVAPQPYCYLCEYV